jgi:hypothetical protein
MASIETTTLLYDTVINHLVLMAYCKPKEEDFNPFKIKLCINKDYSTPTQTHTTNQRQRPEIQIKDKKCGAGLKIGVVHSTSSIPKFKSSPDIFLWKFSCF